MKRKQGSELLSESEEKYRTFFENSFDAIMITALNGSIYSANPAACNMLGYNEKEICKLGRKGLVEQNFQFKKSLLKRKELGKFIGELIFIKKDGSRIPVEISSSVFTNADGRERTAMIIRDIKDRKKTEEALYSSYLYARNLIEASLDPLVTISAEGKITDVNLATEKITGIIRENLIGSDFADYFENPAKAKRGYKTVFSEGIVKDYPLTILHKSGKKSEVLYNASLFRNEKGEVQGVFAAARDITEVKKFEEELRKSKELLEKLNQHLIEVRENERNEIALNLHDDLGQKLTAINLDIAWLKSRIGVQSKAVREKIEEMSKMIKETIESTKETSALLRPAMLFDLGLVAAIKSQIGSFEKQTGIKCDFRFKPEEFILEDRLSLILYRILQESLTNIARHSGAEHADINLYVLKNKVQLIIKDDGSGIEMNQINSFKSLGIAGIKERVNSINGKMIIVGAPGAGTLISVQIPLLKVELDD